MREGDAPSFFNPLEVGSPAAWPAPVLLSPPLLLEQPTGLRLLPRGRMRPISRAPSSAKPVALSAWFCTPSHPFPPPHASRPPQ
jgi:hypothetical protein